MVHVRDPWLCSNLIERRKLACSADFFMLPVPVTCTNASEVSFKESVSELSKERQSRVLLMKP